MRSYLEKELCKEDGSIWQLVVPITTSFFSFIAAVALSHLFTPGEYGVYRYILAWTILSSFFTLSGSNLAVTQAALDGADRTFFSVVRKRVLFGLVGFLFFMCLAGYYYTQGNAELATLFAMYSPFVVISESLTSYLAFLTGKKKLRTAFLFEFLSTFAITLSVLTAAYLNAGIFIVVLVNLFATFLVRLLGTLYTLQFVTTESPIQDVTLYSSKLTLFNSFEIATQFIDKVIVFHFLGAHGLAFYVFTIIFVDQIRDFFRIVIFKQVILENQRQTGQAVGLLRGKLMLYTLVAFIGYGVVAPYLYSFFFPNYVEVVVYSIVYAISFFTVFLYIPMYTYQRERKTRQYGFHQLGIFIATGVCLTIGASSYGLMGAVVGLLLTKVISSLFSLFLYK